MKFYFFIVLYLFLLTGCNSTVSNLQSQILKLTAGTFESSISSVLPSAVVIETDKGNGSGVLLSSDGLIVTNYHVVENSENIVVKIYSGARFSNVDILQIDIVNDLALIKVKAKDLDFIKIQNLSLPSIGETSFTVGAPKGLEQTISKGIISGIRELNNKTLIQTDAAISEGNSGGGLFDENANLIGILVSFYDGQNLNFAVPIKYVSKLLFANKYKSTEKNINKISSLKMNVDNNVINNIKPSDEILKNYLSNFRDLNDFSFEQNLSKSVFIATFESDTTIIFKIFDNVLLMSTPLLNGVDFSSSDFKKINDLSISYNYCYLSFQEGNLSLYAEIPIRSISFEAFSIVIDNMMEAKSKFIKDDLYLNKSIDI